MNFLYACKLAGEFFAHIIRDYFLIRMEGSGCYKHFSEGLLQSMQIAKQDAYFL
jgi:hypothetical protein